MVYIDFRTCKLSKSSSITSTRICFVKNIIDTYCGLALNRNNLGFDDKKKLLSLSMIVVCKELSLRVDSPLSDSISVLEQLNMLLPLRVARKNRRKRSEKSKWIKSNDFRCI